MTRDEFAGLPLSIALGLLWDHAIVVDALEQVPAPQLPRPPKYDQPIYRKGGFQWASETDLESLVYWQERYFENAGSGGQYAEKDAKRAKSLGFWVTWRKAFPTAAWSGERNRVHVVAALPSRTPTLHQREAREAAPSQESKPSFDDEGSDDLPF